MTRTQIALTSTLIWVVCGGGAWGLWYYLRQAGNAAPDAQVVKAQLREQLGVGVELSTVFAMSTDKGLEWQKQQINKKFGLLGRLGVHWSRVCIGWDRIERERDKPSWDIADAVVSAAREHGVNLLWVIDGVPVWASDSGRTSGLPKDLADEKGRYPQFVMKLVERYKADVHHWEIGCEPDLDEVRDSQGALKYPQLLDRASAAIISTDPKAKVVLGSSSGRIVRQIKWTRDLVQQYRNTLAKLPFHVANFQLHGADLNVAAEGSRSAFEQYVQINKQQIDEAMRELQLADMPVWITEFNYAANRSAQLDAKYEGEDGQAQVVSKLFASLVVGHPERKVFWADLLDDLNAQDTLTGFVPISADGKIGEPRPAYQALQTLLAD
ncbi:MAG: hypothetical protein JSS27_18275 [Planctomycetes bacterium]|nr:hypothetical protein [Planctomycetota bacterium]